MIHRHKIVLTLILLMLTAALTVGCGSSTTTLPTTMPTTAAPTAVSTTPAASQNLNGAHVRIPGFWSGSELDRLVRDKDGVKSLIRKGPRICLPSLLPACRPKHSPHEWLAAISPRWRSSRLPGRWLRRGSIRHRIDSKLANYLSQTCSTLARWRSSEKRMKTCHLTRTPVWIHLRWKTGVAAGEQGLPSPSGVEDLA